MGGRQAAEGQPLLSGFPAGVPDSFQGGIKFVKSGELNTGLTQTLAIFVRTSEELTALDPRLEINKRPNSGLLEVGHFHDDGLLRSDRTPVLCTNLEPYGLTRAPFDEP